MLLAVHIPKTAGTSLKQWFTDIYGADRIHFDYADAMTDATHPFHTDRDRYLAEARTFLPASETDVIFGHFWARKYEHLQVERKIAFLRDPIERAISHFYFWKAYTATSSNGFYKRVMQPDYTLREFMQYPLISHFYTRVYFAETSLAEFDFIGDHANYDRELARLGRMLGRTGEIAKLNSNPNGRYAEEKQRWINDAVFMAEARDWMSDDIRFYQRYAGR